MDEKLNQRISEFDDHVPHTMGASGGGVEEITPNVLAAAINRLQVHDDGLPDDILGNFKFENAFSPKLGLGIAFSTKY